jgi:hypothetical protein
MAQKWHYPFGRLSFGFDHNKILPIQNEFSFFTFETALYGTEQLKKFAIHIPSLAW